ncbi:MAG: glycosyltransferase, partial [Nakamurella sp.]
MSQQVEQPSAVSETDCSRYEVVLVTYHSREQLVGLLDSALPDQRLVVVDNASGADGVGDVVRAFRNGRYLDGKNVGFAKAANLGARSSTAEFVIFANPDSRPTPEIWSALVAELIADPRLASVAAAT